jgi:hypothetical protein
VDAAGAAKLRWRIEQQQHWRQAPAVQDGRQPSVDPDMEELVSVGDGIRVYAQRRTSEGVLRLCKRLVEGVWENGTVDESFDMGGLVLRYDHEQVVADAETAEQMALEQQAREAAAREREQVAASA